MNADDLKALSYENKHYIVMANDIVKGKQEMTLTEARIIRLLITQVVKEDKDLKTYTCKIADLADFIGITGKSLYRDIRVICENLLKRIVRINVNKNSWKAFQWIQLAEYDGDTGMITLKLSEQIAPYVLDLNSWFTQYKLKNILHFNSFYAIRLYELLKCEAGIGKDNKECYEFKIDYLREIFCCENKYKTTAEFIKKVIQIGVREINDKSDLEVRYEYIKHSRKIVSIQFTLSYNIKNNLKNTKKPEI
jgi:Protein involved in initiation of plasmid replication